MGNLYSDSMAYLMSNGGQTGFQLFVGLTITFLILMLVSMRIFGRGLMALFTGFLMGSSFLLGFGFFLASGTSSTPTPFG